MRFIKIFLFIAVVFGLNVNAASTEFIEKYKYESDYDDALERAQEESKPIMLVVSSRSCPWCRKFERQTLQNSMIHDIVSKNFIPLAVDKNYSFFPEQFMSKVVPAVFFIDPKSEKAILTSYGYKNKNEFKELLLEDKNKVQQGKVIPAMARATIFSLGGLKEVKVLIFDKKRVLPRKLKQNMKNNIVDKLEKVGLQTNTKLYSKFIVKINSMKLDDDSDTYVINVILFIVEDVALIANKENVKVAITYRKDEMFDSNNLEEDITESVNYLVSEFVEQYKQEN